MAGLNTHIFNWGREGVLRRSEKEIGEKQPESRGESKQLFRMGGW